jgi:polyhydroxyalkanoate synthesis regulator phasin
MDFSQFTNTSTASTGAQVQGTGGHHHHKSLADQINDMNTAIDNAVKAGKLTDDQATAMKKELDDVKQTLSQNQANGSSQTGSATQLSDDDRKKVFSELKDVRKQLHAAMSPQGSAAGASDDQLNKLFSSMDADGNGSVSKEEFEAFMNTLAQKGGYTAQGTLPSNGASAGLSVEA